MLKSLERYEEVESSWNQWDLWEGKWPLSGIKCCHVWEMELSKRTALPKGHSIVFRWKCEKKRQAYSGALFFTQEAELNTVNGPFQDSSRLEMGSEKSTLFSQNNWVVEYRCRRK